MDDMGLTDQAWDVIANDQMMTQILLDDKSEPLEKLLARAIKSLYLYTITLEGRIEDLETE